jgi:hypothetical protein
MRHITGLEVPHREWSEAQYNEWFEKRKNLNHRCENYELSKIRRHSINARLRDARTVARVGDYASNVEMAKARKAGLEAMLLLTPRLVDIAKREDFNAPFYDDDSDQDDDEKKAQAEYEKEWDI